MNTARMASDQASDPRTYPAVLPPPGCGPSSSDRSALTVRVIGWCSSNACNHPGIVCTGTKTEDAKTSGNIQMKLDTCAVSTSPTLIPIVAEIQQKANPKNSATKIASTASKKLVWTRNPIR